MKLPSKLVSLMEFNHQRNGNIHISGEDVMDRNISLATVKIFVSEICRFLKLRRRKIRKTLSFV